MFARRRGTVIAEGLKIIGSVTAEGLVEVNGQIDGDLHCTSLIVSPKACINGGVQAQKIIVNGRVEGPIHGKDVVLKSRAIVIGDIQSESLEIERGAHFEGRSLRASGSNLQQAAPAEIKLRGAGAKPVEDVGDAKPTVKHVA
jgi:cytoskeletal protein CcmA (bactofilin family)